MKKILQIISYSSLVLTATPGILVYMGKIDFNNYSRWVLLGTVLWFATAPFWINKKTVK